MPSLPQRMRKMQSRLLSIRLGSGALVLPKEVKRIHMQFPPRIEGGHMGPKKFWRHELIRLKYHNPAVPMTVDRSNTDTNMESTMSIHFAPHNAIQTSDSATSSPAPIESTTVGSRPSDHTPTERVETIPMKFRTNSQILEDLVRITKAYPIEPTVEDKEEMRGLEEMTVRGEQDRQRSAQARAKAKRENELLRQARGDVAAMSA